MKEIKLTQGRVAKIDDEDYPLVSQFKWYYHSTGYAFTGDGQGGKLRMHYAIMARLPKYQVDHINGDRLDNRRQNLRHVKAQYNCWNKGLPANNTSGYKGVSWDKKTSRWRARIKIDYIQYNLGGFDNAVDGARAYNEAALKHYGKYTRLNVLPGMEIDLDA